MTVVPHVRIRAHTEAMYAAGGLPSGDSTGWPSVDALYTVALSQWTLITGSPHAGKSEWLDALMVNLAKRNDWKFVIYSPENWPLQLHHAKIAEKYVGAPFNPGPTTRMTAEELSDAEDWMHGKFIFAKPEHPSIFAIMQEAMDLLGPGSAAYKRGLVIDPWNQLDHNRPSGMSETEYISQTLSEVIRAVRDNEWHLWLVAHPAKLYRNKDGSKPIPTPADVSGSAHWWAKADNCITVHRDQSEESQEVQIHVQKVRFKHIGHVGQTTLRYDRVTGRYHEMLKVADDYERRRYGD